MNYLNYFNLERPLVPSHKCADFIGAAIGAADNLFNRIESNMQSRRQRNLERELQEKNIAFGREQLAAQRKMFEDNISEQQRIRNEDRNWYLRDVADERAYNSASAIAQRFRAAGINPYLAMNSGAAGQMSGASVAPQSHQSVNTAGHIGGMSASQSSSPIQPYHGDSAGIGRLFNEALFNDAQISRIRMLNTVDYAKAMAAVTQMRADTNYKRAITEEIWQQFRENQESWSDRRAAFGLSNKETQSRIELNVAEANMHDQHSFELLAKAGLERAQANDIVNTAQSRIRLLSAQSVYYSSAGHHEESDAKLLDWWLRPDYAHSVYGGYSHQDVDFNERIANSGAQTAKALREAANYEEMTREQKETFDSVLRYWLHPIAVAAAGGAAYSATSLARGVGEGSMVNESYQVVTNGKTPQGYNQQTTHTVQRKRKAYRK